MSPGRVRMVREMRRAISFFTKPQQPPPRVRRTPTQKETETMSESSEEPPESEPDVVFHLPAGEEAEARQRVKTDNAKVYDRTLAIENEIRLLRIDPGEGPLSGSLQYASLDEAPEYDALSYCWGEQRDYRPINIDDKEGFLISEHLHAAMRRLRRPDQSRLVWIDVICVDQANIPERNRSVQLMWQIYAKAHRVVIWIGETEPAQKTCRRLFAPTKEQDSRLTLCTKPGLAALEHDDAATKLGNILTSMELESSRGSRGGEVWWKRLWVIQEFSRAREHPTVYIGPHAISWPFFATLMRTENHDRLPLFHSLREHKEHSLLQLLHKAKSFYCSDPRDRVYSLLGLVSTETTIVPDYSKPVPEVYEDATLYLMQQERNVDVLLDERLDRTGGGFPTWVPHYTMLRERDVVQSRDGYAAGHSEPVIELVDLPIASEKSKCNCPSTTRRALKMRAIPFSSIATRTTEDHLPAPDSSHRTILTRQGQLRKPELSKPLQTIEQVFEALKVDFSSESTHSLDRSSGVGYLMLDYLFNGTRSAVEEFTRASQHSPWKSKFPTPTKDIDTLAQRFGIQLTEAKKLDFMISALWENVFLTVRHKGIYTPDDTWRRLLGGNQHEMYQVSSKVRKRDFFCTENGFIGMGPATMEVGDEVIVPFGASRPFVVRRHGDHCVLVGDAVVPGIMSGQLMNLCNEGSLAAEDYYLK